MYIKSEKNILISFFLKSFPHRMSEIRNSVGGARWHNRLGLLIGETLKNEEYKGLSFNFLTLTQIRTQSPDLKIARSYTFSLINEEFFLQLGDLWPIKIQMFHL